MTKVKRQTIDYSLIQYNDFQQQYQLFWIKSNFNKNIFFFIYRPKHMNIVFVCIICIIILFRPTTGNDILA